MNRLIALALAMIIILPVADFIGECITWYADSYAVFSGAA